MPVVSEEAVPELRRKRGRGGIWLLLVLPALLIALLVVTAIRPLQVGPIVLVVDVLTMPGAGWSVRHRRVPSPVRSTTATYIRGEAYTLTGGGDLLAVSLGDRIFVAAWFRGGRRR